MRIAVAVGCLAFAQFALAASPECGDLQISYNDDGSTKATVPAPSKTGSIPAWDIANGEPPLSVSRAVSEALAWARAKHPSEEIEINSVSLMPYYCGEKKYWDYWVSLWAPANPNSHESVVVLMDGTVAPSKDVAKKK